METQFTPGPWERDRHGQLRGSDGVGVNVWDAGIGYASRTQTTEVNARLIAAAPELFDALQHILAGALSLPRFAEEEARAALAKARGDQQ